MNNHEQPTRYNQPIPHMDGRWSGGLRKGCRASLSIAFGFGLTVSPAVAATALTDSARVLGHQIASATGPGSIALEVTNRSSLDDKSVEEVRVALEGQLRADGVRAGVADQSRGVVRIDLGENIREYVWTAEITFGSDDHKVFVIAAPRARAGPGPSSTLPLTVRKNFLFAQEQPILDAALVEMGGAQHLLVLNSDQVGVFRQQNGRWELETSLAIAHTRTFPRDTRGRLLLRRDHLFDVYLPGLFCRSNANAPLAVACAESDAPWPLTAEDSGIRASFAPARNFWTGVFLPPIGKVSNGPSFYSAAPLPRSGYTLWVLAAVDGSIHEVDGLTDQLARGVKWGSEMAAVHSGCGTGTQLLVSENGEPSHDSIRAFEIPDRDPLAVSAPVEFDGTIVAVWPESSGN